MDAFGIGVRTLSSKVLLPYINVRENRRDIKHGQSDPEKLDTRRRETKQKHNTICVGHYYTKTHTNNVNRT